jgi:predicted transcriptional regulator
MPRNKELQAWVRRLMYENKISQEELGDILGLSQAAIWGRLSAREDKPDFKLREIEALEKRFNVVSPLRRVPYPKINQADISPTVLKTVMVHIGTEFEGVFAVDAAELSDAVIGLCHYLQMTSRDTLSRAETLLALRGLANDGSSADRSAVERADQ